MKRPSNLIAITTILTGLLVSSCSESKVSQCNKVISIVNKLQPLSENLQKDLRSIEQPKNPEDFNQIKQVVTKTSELFQKASADVGNIKTELRGTNLSDEKLKGFQTTYVANIEKVETGLKSLGEITQKASQVKNRAELENLGKANQQDLVKNFQQADEAIKENQKIGSEINTYCGATPTPTTTGNPPATPLVTPPTTPTGSPPATPK